MTIRRETCISSRASSGPAVAANVSIIPILSSCGASRMASARRCGSRAASCSSGPAQLSNKSPARVSAMGRFPFSTSLTPRSVSSFWIDWDTADCVRFSLTAARVMLLVRATSRKTRTARRSRAASGNPMIRSTHPRPPGKPPRHGHTMTAV